jgi:hypothetical protein
MRFEQLFEAKEIIDNRHENISDILKPWSGGEEYIDPRDGFYWLFKEGKLVLSSTDNEYYSMIANVYATASEEEQELARTNLRQFHRLEKVTDKHKEISNAWNELGGLVNFQTMTLTVSKENVGNSMRQRYIADIATFKQALSSLKKFGLTDEFAIKGAPPEIPKTVGQALQMRDNVQKILHDKDLIMWHGTSEGRWEMIQHKGLQPGKTGEAYVDLIPGYSEHNVYVATTPKGAQYYAKRQAKKDGSKPVVLKVQIPNPRKLIADDRYAHHSTDKSVGKSIDRIKTSIKEMGELGYNGWIPPKFISKK